MDNFRNLIFYSFIKLLAGLLACGTFFIIQIDCNKPYFKTSLAYAIENIGANDKSSVDAAFNFIYRQMDQYHQSVIIVGEPEYQTFFPSGFIGDTSSITIDSASISYPHSGKTCIKATYDPNKQSTLGWAGIYFQYPADNWGKSPGRNLSDAKRLTFWVRADNPTTVEFFTGGINRPPKSRSEYSDSFGPLSTGQKKITKEWQMLELNFKNEDLSSVIGAFGFKFARNDTPNSATIYLDDIAIDLPKLKEPRFIQSYFDAGCEAGAPINISHVYDQALVILALLARGQPEDLNRADLLARALVLAQKNDRTFRDGRLRSAYASGEILDAKQGHARIPGRWNPKVQEFWEDEYSVGTDTGNMAWAGIALLQAHAYLLNRGASPYLQAARDIAQWIVINTKVEDSIGGFSGGFEGFEKAAGDPTGQKVAKWRSTEHNIDFVAFFENLAFALKENSQEALYWGAQANHARHFVEKMKNRSPQGQHFWTGVSEDKTLNKSPIPVDIQSFAVLALKKPNENEKALNWALHNCTAGRIENGFDFNCKDGDGAWWEGTAQVAAALRSLNRNSEAVPILSRLGLVQIKSGPARGAIPAASKCGLTTGFTKIWPSSNEALPWLYPNNPHIGATAWYIFAMLGKNPYYLSSGETKSGS